MLISQKCRYALWAVFELSMRNSSEPAKIQVIADAQGIPARFLEVILSELRHGGFVESRRGRDGGYMLARQPEDLTVGEIIRHVQGPVDVVNHGGANGQRGGRVRGDYAFGQMWEQMRSAVSGIYDGTTFADLVRREVSMRQSGTANYAI